MKRWFWEDWFKKDYGNCGLCGGRIRETSNIIHYKVINDDTDGYETLEMKICNYCADELENEKDSGR